MKKFFLMVVALVATSMAALAASGDEFKEYTTYPGDGKLFAYFCPDSWTYSQEPAVWAWNGSMNFTGGNWPGATMDLVQDLGSGKRVYRWTYDGTDEMPTGIIFNNSGAGWQTSDIAFTNGGVYDQSGSLLYTVTKEGSDEPDPVANDYYMKHPWGTGADTAWAWKKLNYNESENQYYIQDLYGGIGVNVNTQADDAGATWFPVSDITVTGEPAVGDEAMFTYNPTSKTVTIAKVSKQAFFAIAGQDAIVNGEAWAVSEANYLTSTDGEIYILTVSGKSLSKGSYEYKVVDQNNNWFPAGDNKVLNVPTPGRYDITYTLTLNMAGEFDDVNATLTNLGAFNIVMVDGTESRMRSDDGVKYTYTASNITLNAGSYNYSLKGTDKSNTVDIEQNGVYRITYNYNVETDVLSHSLIMTGTINDGHYMKYKWSGADATWKKMFGLHDGRYYVRAQFGGTDAVMVNTSGSDTEATSPEVTVIGAPMLGDICYFYLNTDGTVTIEKFGNVGDLYTVAGSCQILNNFDADWLLWYSANDMTMDEATGKYILKTYGLAVPAGTYSYKAFKDRRDETGYRWPEAEPNTLSFSKAGNYDITYTFDPETGVITAEYEESDPETLYIRHSWGSGEDADWCYKPLEKAPLPLEGEDQIYFIIDVYGGTGCNYGTDTNNMSSNYVPDPTLINDPQVGDMCIFYVNPRTGNVTIVKITDETVVSAVNDVKVAQPAAGVVKVMENGQLVIIKDGIRYNVMGARI